MVTKMFVLVSGPVATTGAGAVTARMSICIESWCFPERDWRDFVVIVTEWWEAALRDLRVRGECVLHFMDGPFEVRLRAVDNDEVLAEFISRTSRRVITERAVTLSRPQLIASMQDGFTSAADVLEDSGRTAEANAIRSAAMRIPS